jgi:hypothetical protein
VNTNYQDEGSSPAKEMFAQQPDQMRQMSDARQRLLSAMSKLAWLRQGHEGPDIGTKYNIPLGGGSTGFSSAIPT